MSHLSSASATRTLICSTAVTTLLFWWAYYIFPTVADDIAFLAFWNKNITPDNSGYTFQGWLRFVHHIRTTDNSRLCNLIAPVWLVYIPLWLRTLLAALATAGSIIMLSRLGFRRFSIIGTALMTCAAVILLPWRDLLLLNDYTLNYVYAGLISLILTGYLCGAIPTPSSRYGHTLLFLLALLAGCWTEVFAVPTLAGLACVALARRLRMPGWWWGCIAALAAGMAIFGISPGAMNRGDRQIFAYTDNYFFHLLMRQPSVLVMITFSALCLSLKQFSSLRHRLLHNQVAICMWGIMFSGFAMTCMLPTGPRASYWPIAASLILAAITLRPYLSNISSHIRTRLAWTILIPTWLLIIAQMPAIYRYDEESKRINEVLATSTADTLKMPLTDFEAMPRATTLFIYRPLWSTRLQHGCLEERYPIYSIASNGDTTLIAVRHD